MKALYIPVTLLTLILLFSVFTGVYVRQCTQDWVLLLEQCEEFLREEQWERTEDRLTRAYESWQEHSVTFHIILEHRDLEEAENIFSGAFAACRDRNGEDLSVLLRQLTSQILYIAETQEADVKNIL